MSKMKQRFAFGIKEIFPEGISVEKIIVRFDTGSVDKFMCECGQKLNEYDSKIHMKDLKDFSKQELCRETGISAQQFEDYVSAVYRDERFEKIGVSLDQYDFQEGKLEVKMSTVLPAFEQFWRVQNRAFEIRQKHGIELSIPNPLMDLSPTFVDGLLISADSEVILGVRDNKSDINSGEILVCPAGGIDYKSAVKSAEELIIGALWNETLDEVGLGKEYFSNIRLAGLIYDGTIAFGNGFVFTMKSSLPAECIITNHQYAYQMQTSVMGKIAADNMNKVGFTSNDVRRQSYQVIRAANKLLKSAGQPILPEDAWEHSMLLGLPFDKQHTDIFLVQDTYQGYPILEEARGDVYIGKRVLLDKK